jgi:hypothetical protein
MALFAVIELHNRDLLPGAQFPTLGLAKRTFCLWYRSTVLAFAGLRLAISAGVERAFL